MGGRRRINAKTPQLSTVPVLSEPKAEPKASVEEQILALHKRQEADLAKLLAQKLQPSIVVPDQNSAVSSAATNSAKPAATNLPNGPLVKDPGPILISEFEELTGVPVVLNTSFNLNGEPIVVSPTDAIRTFYSCGLDALIMGNYLVRK